MEGVGWHRQVVEREKRKTARCTRLFLGASHGGETEDERERRRTKKKKRDKKRLPTTNKPTRPERSFLFSFPSNPTHPIPIYI